MKNLIKTGDIIRIVDFDQTQTQLEPLVYLLMYNDTYGYHLVVKEDFKLPNKLYGNFDFINRWINAADNSTKNLGILLSGLKGSGKTIAAKKFCIDSKRPVILINVAYSGVAFESFLSSPLLTNAIVFIDEYEKYYNEGNDNIDSLLTLMDGVYSTKLVYLLTVNDETKVSDKLKNRLGRIKYYREYESCDYSIIDGMIEDSLINKDHKESIDVAIKKLGFMTPDILSELLKEMNTYNEDALTSLSYLNIHSEDQLYTFTFKKNDVELVIRSMTFNVFDDMLDDGLFFISQFVRSFSGVAIEDYAGQEDFQKSKEFKTLYSIFDTGFYLFKRDNIEPPFKHDYDVTNQKYIVYLPFDYQLIISKESKSSKLFY